MEILLQFDAETARILEDSYQGSDVQRRRLANIAALAPSAGERIVDIGAGNGLLSLDISRAVGPEGGVTAVDPSPDMREAATQRCAGRDNIRIVPGDAAALPLDDASVDGAVALQVFEYLDDIPAALAEAYRVLRPGGRLVIGDFHWDSQVWHADAPDRTARILRMWDRHMVWRTLPAHLPGMLRAAGFEVSAVVPELFHDTQLRTDGIARMMMLLISAYARQTGAPEASEVDGWLEEQHRLAAEGRFFFALTHYVTSARKV